MLVVLIKFCFVSMPCHAWYGAPEGTDGMECHTTRRAPLAEDGDAAVRAVTAGSDIQRLVQQVDGCMYARDVGFRSAGSAGSVCILGREMSVF